MPNFWLEHRFLSDLCEEIINIFDTFLKKTGSNVYDSSFASQNNVLFWFL